jgi:hypothetical protein
MTRFLTEKHISSHLSVSVRTLQNWRRIKQGPPFHKAGRRVLYDPAEVDAWIRSVGAPGSPARPQI